jgi:predicted O-methyltransferase YrrM
MEWSLMKPQMAFVARSLAPVLDVLFSLMLPPALWCLRLTKRIGLDRMPRTRGRFLKSGVIPITNHYYEPFVDHRKFMQPLSSERYLPGIDIKEQEQLGFLSHLRFADELKSLNFPKHSSSHTEFCTENGSFGPGDFDFLYQFIRFTQPRRVLEIGSGNSTKIAQLALRKNGMSGEHICIEPFENPWLEDLGVRVIRERVETCDLSMFKNLEQGDLLFIDSSHVIRPQGDVLHEYLVIIPLLRDGVFVHVHDVFTPSDYPETYIVEHGRIWSEQYLVEALLHNSRYKVVAMLNYLTRCHHSTMRQCCPYLTDESTPSSLYFQVQ